MNKKALRIDERDNAYVALCDLKSHTEVDGIVLCQDISAKHKFSAIDFDEGDTIVMYGVTVGTANEQIAKGSLLTTENITHAVENYNSEKSEYTWKSPNIDNFKTKSFMGYHREDGKVGTANHWLVIPLVFCENQNIDKIKDALTVELGYARENHRRSWVKKMVEMQSKGEDLNTFDHFDVGAQQAVKERVFKNIDGIRFLNHEGGCGGASSDSQSLIHLLAGYIVHPNCAGATVLGLGCQKAQEHELISEIKKRCPDYSRPLITLEQQAEESEEHMIQKAIKETLIGLSKANTNERKAASLNKFVMGVECGGSDGFSGISSNPVIGAVSDLLATLEGTPVLSEFPELCGVEQNLINRCSDEKIANRFHDLIHTYESKANSLGESFSDNPSPGNIREGLITDAIKSAGAAKKGGISPVTDVLDYTEPITKSGLNLLNTPGNDVESTTALVGSGANIILFSTGLGTPTGNPLAPVIKVSSNSEIAKRLSDIIDFDTGPVISGEKSIEDLAEDLLNLMIDIASGTLLSKAEINHHYEFIPWKRGLSL
jgi:altronate hydrolase